MNKIKIIILLLLSTLKVWSADGDVFTAKTIEGVEMTFKVISESNLTCQVGRIDGEWAPNHAISQDYEGNITIPSYANGYHVIRIGRAAFDHCQMASIIIPPDIETIFNEAFNNCTNLTSITIPYSVAKIGDLAFNNCSNLTLVKSEIEQPYVLEDDVFRQISPNAVLQVPRGTKESYQSNNSWSKNFTSIEEYSVNFSVDNINYVVVSEMQKTVNLASGDYGLTLTVPSSITAKGKEWKVVGFEADVLKNAQLAAIIWNPEVKISGNFSNPNLLLYVKDKNYAPSNIMNVIANGVADEIVLKDAESGNNFYCPQAFTAKRVSYVHNYSMKSGYKKCQGWETIVLPFDVTTILNATGNEIVPINALSQGDSRCPFWLYSLSNDGWKAENSIKANTPYIISMPNNEMYDAKYRISGDVQFIGTNVQIAASDNLPVRKSGDRSFVPNYQNQDAAQDIYALNVNNLWNINTDPSLAEGSVFIRDSRKVRPFEAYMTTESSSASQIISIFDDEEVTRIMNLPLSNEVYGGKVRVFSLSGAIIKQGEDESVLHDLPKGVYIVNGKKVLVK